MKRIALLDTDGLCYWAACRGEQKCNDAGDTVFLPLRSVAASYAELVDAIDTLAAAVGCGTDFEGTQVYLCLTHGENFRKGVLSSYKGNRKDMRKPDQLMELRRMLCEEQPYPVLLIKGLEADDVLGISTGFLTAAPGNDVIMVSEDKDLRTVPGKLYRQGQIEEITPEAADYWHMFQTLTGDPVDGYGGCPGVGKSAAHRTLQWTPRELWWDAVVSAFEDAYREASWWFAEAGIEITPEEIAVLAETDALTQARCARILRSTDWNAETGEAILWEPNTGGKEKDSAATHKEQAA